MTLQAGPLSDLVAPRLERREVALWSAAALVVVAAHAGSAWLISQSRAPVPLADAAPAAIMLELAPMTIAPEAVPMDSADLVDSAMVEPSQEPVETVEPVPEQAEPVTDPVVEVEVSEIIPEQADQVEPETVEAEQAAEPPPEETVVTTEEQEVVPDIVEAPLPEVAMAVPKTEPVEKAKPAAKPAQKPKPVEKQKAETKPPPKRKPAPQASLAMKKSAQNAPKAAAAAGNQGVGGSSMSPATWEKLVNRHISRRQRPINGRGTVQILFSVSAGGDVLSVSVAGSSGNAKLDAAAVSLVQRSSPLPAPPPDLPKSKRTVRVPVVFR